MQRQILQSPWQKAKHLRPKLSSEVEVFRRSFRGEQWHVLRRSGSERLYRVNPEAWRIIGLCNGERRLDTILANLREQNVEIAESDLLGVISQLAQQGLIVTDVKHHIPQRVRGRQSQSWLSRLRNPIAIRFPLWDPDRFLRTHLDKVSMLFSWQVLALWGAVVLVALVVAIFHWGEISNDIVDRVLNPKNLALLWFIYPVTKLLHELAHAFAIKIRGGEVHEIGITLIYGVPMPYVDASDSLTFSHKRHRLLVDAIGIMVELFIASIALFVWLNTSAGFVSQLAYNAMIICSVSTIFFNGNPLMRYDGYYLLADFLEIPNLATRSLQYWRYLFNRYALGLDKTFEVGDRERKWLIMRVPFAFIYRTMVLTTIILVTAERYLPLGIILGVWLLVLYVFNPLSRGIHYLLSPSLGQQKTRGIKILVMIPLALLIILAIPVPLQRTMPAVVWLPDNAKVRAGTNGVIKDILFKQGDAVAGAQPLFRLSNPYLTSKRNIAQAKYNEVSARLDAARADDLVKAQQLQEDLKSSEAELSDLQQQLQQLQVDSPRSGNIYLPPGKEERGRYVRQGDLLAYVLNQKKVILRVLVGQNDIGMIRARSRSLQVKLANWPEQVYSGKIIRFIPSASNRLPNAVLGTRYGGPITVDPDDKKGLSALTEWFQLDVEVQGLTNTSKTRNDPLLWAGSRAWVRFDLGYESVATQLYWVLSQLLMKKLLL